MALRTPSRYYRPTKMWVSVARYPGRSYDSRRLQADLYQGQGQQSTAKKRRTASDTGEGHQMDNGNAKGKEKIKGEEVSDTLVI